MSWLIFGICILSLLALDLFVFHRKPHAVSFKEALTWSAVWIALALLFNVYIYFTMGGDAALNFLTGYLIEKSLSIDNLFVFVWIFSYFQTPQASLHKVLFWGVLGAIVTRALFIALGLFIVQYFHPIIYLFGLFLIYTGIKFTFKKESQLHLEKNPLIRLFSRIFPITPEYVQDHFFTRRQGRFFLTPLFLVLLAIETTDIVFAIDSIPAILAITYDPFIVYTSNIFAILGLRSLFFLLSGSLQYFQYLHYGIAAILIFVGVKMVLTDLIHISPFTSLVIVFVLFASSMLASILLGKKKKKKDKP